MTPEPPAALPPGVEAVASPRKPGRRAAISRDALVELIAELGEVTSDQLAERTSVKKTTLFAHLNALMKAGAVTVLRKDGKSRVYGIAGAEREPAPPAESAAREDGAAVAPPRAGEAPAAPRAPKRKKSDEEIRIERITTEVVECLENLGPDSAVSIATTLVRSRHDVANVLQSLKRSGQATFDGELWHRVPAQAAA